MKDLKMKFKMILAASAFLCMVQLACAQSAPKKITAAQGGGTIQSFAVIGHVVPVKIADNGVLEPGSEIESFSFDIEKVKKIMPQLIRNETTWTPRGKNNQVATNKETVDLVKLVPLLMAALQQQNTEIKGLKLKLNDIEKQLNPDRQTFKPADAR